MVARHRAAAAETVRLEHDPSVKDPRKTSGALADPHASLRNPQVRGLSKTDPSARTAPRRETGRAPHPNTKPQVRRPSRPVRGSRRTPCGASSERDRPGRGRKKSRSEAICPPVVPRSGAPSVTPNNSSSRFATGRPHPNRRHAGRDGEECNGRRALNAPSGSWYHQAARRIEAYTLDAATTPPQLCLGSRRALADLTATRTRWTRATQPPPAATGHAREPSAPRPGLPRAPPPQQHTRSPPPRAPSARSRACDPAHRRTAPDVPSPSEAHIPLDLAPRAPTPSPPPSPATTPSWPTPYSPPTDSGKPDRTP